MICCVSNFGLRDAAAALVRTLMQLVSCQVLACVSEMPSDVRVDGYVCVCVCVAAPCPFIVGVLLMS